VDLDPAVSLAFTIRANPGAYALLLGSGVSGDAVPTGWEVFVELVGSLAGRHGVTGRDPVEWYRELKQGPIGYETVLADLTDTPAERVGLLRPYFEPGPDDAEADRPGPTEAHRAIARLVAAGLVRVVLTTNLDRLLERALEEVGVAPTILASPSAVAGMAPLHQQRACVVKLHGDYLDPGFLNTGEELSGYPEAVDRLLDRVLDEYGLVIAGWSSASDAALRDAIERCTTRRYGSFWVEAFELNEHGARLRQHRGATLVKETADAFFVRLGESVDALDRVDSDHPATVPIAVATAKRHVERRDLIRLHDMLAAEFGRAQERIGRWAYHGSEQFMPLVERIERAMRLPCALVATVAFWGDETTDGYWRPTLLSWTRQEAEGGLNSFLDLRRYPATLLLYAAGVAMMADGRLLELEGLLRERTAVGSGPISSELLAGGTLSGLPARTQRDQASDRVHDLLFPVLADQLFLGNDAAEQAYERFEYLMFLVSSDDVLDTDRYSSYRSVGRIRPTGGLSEDKARPAVELEAASREGVHPWVAAGLFGGDSDRFAKAAESFAEFYAEVRRQTMFATLMRQNTS